MGSNGSSGSINPNITSVDIRTRFFVLPVFCNLAQAPKGVPVIRISMSDLQKHNMGRTARCEDFLSRAVIEQHVHSEQSGSD